MIWIDNNGGFKAHRKHWVDKSRRREGEEGRGRRREEGVKGKEGGGKREEGGEGGGAGWKEEGRGRRGEGGGSSSQTVQSVDYLFSRSLSAASGIM